MIASGEPHVKVSRLAVGCATGVKVVIGRHGLYFTMESIAQTDILGRCHLIACADTWLYCPAIAESKILCMHSGIEHHPPTELMLPGHIAFHQVAVTDT